MDWRRVGSGIRDNLIWQIIVWLFGGGLVTAIAVLARAIRNHPFEWHFAIIVFVISALTLAVVFLLAGRKSVPQQAIQSALPTTSAAVQVAQPVQPIIVDTARYFREAYCGQVQAETESGVRAMIQAQPSDKRDEFVVRFIATGIVNVIYDQIWKAIFRSQILALEELNHRLLRKEELKPFFDDGVSRNPAVYQNYSFDQWVQYMKEQLLVLEHPGKVFEITVRGKDFLKYMVHFGFKPEKKIA